VEFEAEKRRKDSLWELLVTRADPDVVSPQLLSAIGLRPHRTAQGIFRDKEHTEPIAPPHGFTFSLLFAGQAYDDAFDDD